MRHSCIRRPLLLVAISACLVSAGSIAMGQVVATTRAVGGVSINADGILDNASIDDLRVLQQLRSKSLEQIPGELSGLTELRKVSLRQLESTISECTEQGKPLPDAAKYLAGLQRIQYVFVYPDQQDIVLVGPAEGWKVDGKGNVIGVSTGRPVMLLDDLLVALRSARQAAQGGITCSIDPTQEGLARLQSVIASAQRQSQGGNVRGAVAAIEEAMGPQKITIGGVPDESHFARVLVAADYRMKRIAMKFERSPVQGLPSYLDMAPASRGSVQTPRWWLEPNYQPILKDAAGLAWELRGGSVKCMTEEEFLAANGQRERSGKSAPMAQKWADLMTEKYDALAVAEPVFGQLRNCMELAIVSALIVKERLPEKAGQSFPVLLESEDVKTEEYPPATSVATKASLVRKSGNWLVSVSGGVLVNSWGIADKTEVAEAPAQARSQAGEHSGKWWWN
ncbi:MAG: DUF1598 domain-containing protein [Planctomycetota bacterium]